MTSQPLRGSNRALGAGIRPATARVGHKISRIGKCRGGHAGRPGDVRSGRREEGAVAGRAFEGMGRDRGTPKFVRLDLQSLPDHGRPGRSRVEHRRLDRARSRGRARPLARARDVAEGRRPREVAGRRRPRGDLGPIPGHPESRPLGEMTRRGIRRADQGEPPQDGQPARRRDPADGGLSRRWHFERPLSDFGDQPGRDQPIRKAGPAAVKRRRRDGPRRGPSRRLGFNKSVFVKYGDQA